MLQSGESRIQTRENLLMTPPVTSPFDSGRESPPCIVTLVHGTFANQAAWTNSDSKLSKYLLHKLPQGTTLKRFQWSGRNSHFARYIASQQLRDEIIKLRRSCPNSPHFILAHSHGGNIAMYACSDAFIEEMVSGIVCLATPFLNVRERELGPGLLIAAGSLLGVVLGVSLQAIAPHASEWTGRLVAGLVAVPVVLLLMYVSHRWLAAARRLVAEMSVPTFTNTEMLVIRLAGDEASAILGTIQFTCSLVGRGFSFALDGIARLSKLPLSIMKGEAWTWKWFRWVMLTAFASLGAAIISLQFDRTGNGALLKVFVALFALSAGGLWLTLMVAGLAVMLVSVLALPLLTTGSLLSLAFGPELVLHSLFVEATSEAVPRGASHVELVDRKVVALGANRNALVHSEIYNNDKAISLATEWIHDRIKAR